MVGAVELRWGVAQRLAEALIGAEDAAIEAELDDRHAAVDRIEGLSAMNQCLQGVVHGVTA
ncbi:hypothetical protein D3C81_2253260 [compost metagenome]